MSFLDWIRGKKAENPENKGRRLREQAKSAMGQSRVVTTGQLGEAYGVQVVEDKALDLVQSAQHAQESGNYNQAQSLYREAIAIQPDFVDAHNGLAATHLGLGDIDAAVKEYKVAIQYSPSHLDDKIQVIYVNIGNAIRKKGLGASAIPEFKAAVAGLPQSSGYHCALGILYNKAGDTSNARTELQEVLKIDANGLLGQAATQLLGQIGTK